MTQIQRDERSLRRATWITALLAAMVGVGFVYVAFLIEDFPNHISQFAAEFISKTVCVLEIGSLVSLLAFGWMGIRNRRELNLRRQECRLLVTALLERRLGDLPMPHPNGQIKEPEAVGSPRQAGKVRNGAG